MKIIFIIIIAIALLILGKVSYEFGAHYFRQEEALDPEYVISDPIEPYNVYGIYLKVTDSREEKNKHLPIQDDLHAKHYADVRIEIDDQVRELTFTEFKELIFGEELTKGKL